MYVLFYAYNIKMKKTSRDKTSFSPAKTPAPAQVRKLFLQLASLAAIVGPPDHYERLWTPLITLWYFIWQWLQPHHTLEAVVTDARRGGADRLTPKNKRLSQRIKSRATTSYCQARQRLPLAWLRDCFLKLGQQLRRLAGQPDPALPVELLDGSTKRLRPYGDIAQGFPPHRTRRQRSYWCVARVLVSFCATTGIAMGALIASNYISEQAMAVQLMLEAAKHVLYIGDRNFGVWRVVRAAKQSGGHALVRLTQVRARRLLGKKRLPNFLDLPLQWIPSSHDQVDPGLSKEPVQGRLIIVRAVRPGWRPQTLYLFTTLTDVRTYPPRRLLEMYGWRWQAELNFRTVKDTMEMDRSEAKSADMVRKEFYAGLMAYNLVRGLMTAAAGQTGGSPSQLSFAKVRLLLAAVIVELWMSSMSRAACDQRLLWLLTEASAARLPHRVKPRQNEPRAQYYEPQIFPKIKGPRSEARLALKKSLQKN
jgi:putative transposase